MYCSIPTGFQDRRVIHSIVVMWFCVLCSESTVAQTELISRDDFVPHISTVDANAGELVSLFLHEKLSRDTAELIGREDETVDVVLFVHGGSNPCVPSFDLPFKDYSWMEYLARDGFDTFCMDLTGYGFSPRPAMDNPCNMSPVDQEKVIPVAMPAPCTPDYRRLLTSFETDWDEIDTVVNHLRESRNVDSVHLVGWSMGGARVGGYASLHPEKVGRIVLFAPFYNPEAAVNSSNVPMRISTRAERMNVRWGESITCENQVDPAIRDVIWQTVMGFDALGAIWNADDGVMRWPVFDITPWSGHRASQVESPTLILVGAEDGLLENDRRLYSDLTGTEQKVLVEMDCATHSASMERTQYRFIHSASREWLRYGEIRGLRQGVLTVGVNGAPKSN